MSTLLKMQKFHPLCSRCIGMYPLQNRWTVLRYLQCYENFSECCTHLILPETALFSPTPTFAKEPIFLGTRECQGYVKPCVFGEGEGYYDNSGEMPYSLMYHGITYADEAELPEDKGKMTVRFWKPVIQDGVIQFLPPAECTIKRHIKKMSVKKFGKEQGNFSGLEEFTGGETDELDE